MIYLKQNLDIYQSDFRQMIQAFLPGEKIVLSPEGCELTFEAFFREEAEDTGSFQEKSISSFRDDNSNSQEVVTAVTDDDAQSNTKLLLWKEGQCLDKEELWCDYKDRQKSRNLVKAAAYHLLSRYTRRTLPWGSMTGVRPTKFATARVEAGWSDEEIIHEYETTYLTTRQKGEIC